MPAPPPGEAELRSLARRYDQAEGEVLGILANVAGLTAATPRRRTVAEALALLRDLRNLDARGPVAEAYLFEHPDGRADAVRDLAGSLHARLDRAAQTALEGAQEAFSRVTLDNLHELAPLAILAAVDKRGTRWSLSRWATMNTQTIGRQATSRGIADREGNGATVRINTGECEWCREHGGDAIVGTSPLPPYHPSCSCTVTVA